MEQKVWFEVNQSLELKYNSNKEVKIVNFSPDHHGKYFYLKSNNLFFANELHITLPLKEKCIHIWSIQVDGKYTNMSQFLKIKYWGNECNVICVGYKYSLELIQALYFVLDKLRRYQLVISDLEDFFTRFKGFDINSKLVCFSLSNLI
eukprot:TRINITY_DN17611_c0_g1_i2.p1 TRINITY_DN17611_c0_g1~~TRINITY_DN17611_c0_g1_i2.p1  ORF type:complete len:148 (+),score=34.34 TRINITY_DN17611_c0_g1_i2:18-461(+)